MADPRAVKTSKVVEAQLQQAAEFLVVPSAFSIPDYSLQEYERNLRVEELCEGMLRLERTALGVGCKSGFWRRLKKAAVTLKLDSDAERYEQYFHQALSKGRRVD